MPVLDTVFGVINGQGMPILLRFSQWFTAEGAPRLQDFAIKAAILGQTELPKLMTGAKNVLANLQPLVDPLKQLAGQLFGLLPAVAQSANLMSVFGSASSSLPSLLNLIVLALKLASPLIKTLSDNASILAPILYAVGTAFAVWKAMALAQLILGIAGAFTAMAAQEGILAAVTSLLGISFGPLTIVLLAVAAVVGLLALAWKNNWGDIQGKTRVAIQDIGAVIGVVGPFLKTWIIQPMANLVGVIKGHWDSIKAVIGDALAIISSLFRGDVGGAVKAAGDLFGRVAGAIVGIFKNIHIPMPHFSFHGSMNPVDWAKGNAPGLDVSWYGAGGRGIAWGPTLIGIGERGPEAFSVQPLGAGGGGGGDIFYITINGNVDSADRVRELALAIGQDAERQRRAMGGRSLFTPV